MVDYAGMDMGETDIWIVKLSKVVLVDCLLELVPEALGDNLEGVIDELDALWKIGSSLRHWVNVLARMSSKYLPGLIGG